MKVRLRVMEGPARGQVHDLEGRQSIIGGRGNEAAIVFPDKAMSRHHFRLAIDPPRARIEDLDSRHGTLVNGRRVADAELQHGDMVEVGETIFRFELVSSASETALDATGMSHDRASTPDGSSTGALSVVRCRCGRPAPNERPRPREDDVAYLCDPCQEQLIATPSLPAGFTMVRLLGRGAMGCVYLVHDRTGAEFAIKQILPRAAMSASARALFLREARVQATLEHSNIVRVHDLCEPLPGAFCIVMEFVPGQSADRVAMDRPMDPRLAIEIACQALDGMQHAHDRSVVHRDLKEANLMVIGAGPVAVKVADFGLAKNYQESGASGFTHDGMIGGSLAYMPREQLLDYRRVQPAADLYALGSTLYRLLTATYPREFPPNQNPVRIILETPIVPLAVRASWLPARLCSEVDRALSDDPVQRHRSAGEMRDALLQSI